MSSFHYGCTNCNKISVRKIPRQLGYTPFTYYLCRECLPGFIAEYGLESLGNDVGEEVF